MLLIAMTGEITTYRRTAASVVEYHKEGSGKYRKL